MPLQLKIHGSNPRDFAMLERNLLTHLRFATALTLFAGSMLLNARLPSPEQTGATEGSPSDVPLAALQVIAAIITIAAGLWQYAISFKDIRALKAFLSATKSYATIMSVVVASCFATCVVLLIRSADDV